MGKLRPTVVAVLAVGAGILAAACSGPSDPVRAALDKIVRAADARDADGVFERVAPGFQGADGSGFAEAKSIVERSFAAYEILDVKIRDVTIERAEGAARVRLRADLSGQPRKIGGLEGLVPSSSAYDFELRLVPEGGTWKVAWAQWNPASPEGRSP